MNELTIGQHIMEENSFLVYSVCMGIGVTFIYDFFRIFRKLIPHKNIAVSLEDIVFWIFCAISVFYLMHRESNGTLRWFAVLGGGLGMAAYKKVISRPFVTVSVWIGKRILRVVGAGVEFMGRPAVKAAARARKTCRRAGKYGHKCTGFLKKKLTVCTKMLRMILCKQ